MLSDEKLNNSIKNTKHFLMLPKHPQNFIHLRLKKTRTSLGVSLRFQA